jgi:PAS domain S-box-containing protein
VFEAATNIAFIITDLNIYDPHILEFSPGAEQVFGYTRTEMLHQSITRLHQPETVQRFPEMFEKMRHGQNGFVGEITMLRKSGEAFPVFFSIYPIIDENGLMYAALTISFDISAQKQMQTTLRNNEQLLRSVISNTAVVVFALDKTGRFLLSEGKGLSSLGLSAGQVVGTSVFDVYANHPQIESVIRRAMNGEAFSDIIEINNLYFETWYSPMLNQEHEIIGTIGVAVDITERIAQETQRQLNEQRLQAMLQLYALSGNSNQEICDYALEQAVLITQSEIGYLAFLSEDKSILHMYSWSKTAMQQCQINNTERDYPVCLTGLWGEAVRQRKPIFTNNYNAPNPIKKGYPEGHVPIQRHLNLPVFEGNRIVAVIGVGNKQNDYDENDVRQLTLLINSTWDILRRKQAEQDLKDSLSFNENLMAATPSIVFILDLKQKQITYVNDAINSTLGYSIAEFLQNGQNYGLSWIHPEDKARLISLYQNSSQASDLDIYVYEYRMMRKDGKWRWFLGRLKALKRDEQGRVQQLIGMATDITERKLAEEGLRESEEKFRTIIEQFSEGFVLVDEKGCISEWNAANERITGIHRTEAIGMPFWDMLYRISIPERQTPERMELFRNATLKALQTGESPQFYKPIEVVLQTSSGQRKFIEQILFPIRTDQSFRIGSIISDITERKIAEERLRDSAQQLALAYDATLQGWSLALELRERETAGHSQRVVSRTVTLAQRLNIAESQLEHIRRGALLHDIGKMAIPDQILLKNGPLSPEEWAIMRQHPLFAYRLLQSIPYLRPALEIPYSHHERWDGSGYPEGLKGEEIPLSARIFAVVDVWDALTSERPYKPAWGAEATRQFLLDNAGKLFDPKVVQEYLQMLDEENQENSAGQSPSG